jgi:general secretion pathway protein I
MRRRGFTLLEVMVATLIMAIAVVGLLSSMSTSMRNAARLTDYDRAALVARARMDALLLDRRLPLFSVLQGAIDPTLMGGVEAGWRARVTPFELPASRAPGMMALERIELEIWWTAGSARRLFTLEAYRRKTLLPQDIAALPQVSP